MATDFDPDFRFPLGRRLFFKVKGPKILSTWRAIQRRLFKKSNTASSEVSAAFDIDWDSVAKQYNDNKWVFIDQFFTESFYQTLIAGWPSKMYLNPPKRATKWYNTGFWWKESDQTPLYLDIHDEIRGVLAGLQSSNFIKPLSEAIGVDMKLTELHLTDSGPGAEVPMHLDSLVESEGGLHAIGIAIFVQGSGGPDSGGLCVSKSSKWDDLIFEPQALNNSALIYSKQLHHGFKPIAPGKFRKSLNTQFWPTDGSA